MWCLQQCGRTFKVWKAMKGNDNGFDSDDDDIERIPGRNFLSKLWGKIKEGVTPPEFVDDDDEEEDD